MKDLRKYFTALTFIVIAFCFYSVQAQELIKGDEAEIEFKGDPEKVRIFWSNGDISVRGHKGNNVKIKIYNNLKGSDDDQEQSRGLKRFRRYNDSVEYEIRGSEIIIDCNSRPRYVRESYGNVVNNHYDRSKSINAEILVPENIVLDIDQKNHGNAHVEDFTGELNVDTEYDNVMLSGIAGSISAVSKYADVEVELSDMSEDWNYYFEASYDDVDITIPADKKFNVEIRTNNQFYTDFDLDQDGRRSRGWKKQRVAYSINGGGVEVGVKATYGNVYLRKKR
ncbi:MAG: DUF4097 domain-containing protein [bacterium]|nr:DUF4097 domain-containing protein [bacterium]